MNEKFLSILGDKVIAKPAVPTDDVKYDSVVGISWHKNLRPESIVLIFVSNVIDSVILLLNVSGKLLTSVDANVTA